MPDKISAASTSNIAGPNANDKAVLLHVMGGMLSSLDQLATLLYRCLAGPPLCKQQTKAANNKLAKVHRNLLEGACAIYFQYDSTSPFLPWDWARDLGAPHSQLSVRSIVARTNRIRALDMLHQIQSGPEGQACARRNAHDCLDMSGLIHHVDSRFPECFFDPPGETGPAADLLLDLRTARLLDELESRLVSGGGPFDPRPAMAAIFCCDVGAGPDHARLLQEGPFRGLDPSTGPGSGSAVSTRLELLGRVLDGSIDGPRLARLKQGCPLESLLERLKAWLCSMEEPDDLEDAEPILRVDSGSETR
jgi:hypothetical protein